MNEVEVILLSPHDEILEKINQLMTEIRQIPFMDASEYYSITQKINYIIDYIFSIEINKNSYEYMELKLKIKEILFDV